MSYRVILANSKRVMADYPNVGYETYNEVCRFMEGMTIGAHCAGAKKAGAALFKDGEQVHSCDLDYNVQNIVNMHLLKEESPIDRTVMDEINTIVQWEIAKMLCEKGRQTDRFAEGEAEFTAGCIVCVYGIRDLCRMFKTEHKVEAVKQELMSRLLKCDRYTQAIV